jgi:hypothetical protein
MPTLDEKACRSELLLARRRVSVVGVHEFVDGVECGAGDRANAFVAVVEHGSEVGAVSYEFPATGADGAPYSLKNVNRGPQPTWWILVWLGSTSAKARTQLATFDPNVPGGPGHSA